MTRLKVYDTETPDGQYGGTPHFHFMCTEMYFVVAGSGHVELIDHNGFSRVDLYPHSALIFSPGTIHRLINPNRDLELLVVMQNSGLPERGDNVVCFGEEWMADDAKFAEAMKVSSFEEVTCAVIAVSRASCRSRRRLSAARKKVGRRCNTSTI
ncbi:MAG: cupin domain-containing protein [Anaerolineae bacterium]